MQPFEEACATKDGVALSVQCFFRHIGEQSVRYQLHYHDYIELLYGIDGEARVLVGERWYTMGKGDFFAIAPHQVHDVVAADRTADYFVVRFLPEVLYRGAQDADDLPYLLLLYQKNRLIAPVGEDHRADPFVACRMNEIMEEWTGGRFARGLLIRAALVRLMVHLWRQTEVFDEVLADGLSGTLALPIARAMEGARRALATYSVRDAAREANMSYSYFSRVFRRIFGKPFCTYLEELRLEESVNLLLMGDSGIAEVAATVGFHSASHFVDRFRRRYGQPPGAYRQAVRRRMQTALPTEEDKAPAEETPTLPLEERRFSNAPDLYAGDPCAF